MKKFVLLSSLFIFVVSAMYHSLYQVFPSVITEFLFPVNESIWEHNKMILMAYVTFMIIYKLLNKESNIIYGTLISSLLCMLLVMVIFTPVYFYLLDYQDNFIITMIIFISSIVISQVMMFKILSESFNKKRELISLGLLVILIGIFGYFTYYPLEIDIMKELALCIVCVN